MRKRLLYGLILFACALGVSPASYAQWSVTGYGIYTPYVLATYTKGGTNLVGTVFNGIFASSDGGVTWHPSNTGIPAAFGLPALQTTAFVGLGGKIFAGTLAGVYVSSDNGATWSFSGIADVSVSSFAISGANLFASGGGGPYVSFDLGLTWTKVATGLPVGGGGILTAAGTILFNTDGNGNVYTSVDQGANWSKILSLTAASYSITATGNHVFLGTNTGTYHSSDLGATWSLQANAPHDAVSLTTVGTTVFTGAVDGIYKSIDNGITWQHLGGGFPSNDVRNLAADGTVMLGSAPDGPIFSTDGGASWAFVTGIRNPPALSLILLGGHSFAGNHQGILRSLDNGANWSAANTGMTNHDIAALTTTASGILAGTNGGGVFRSINDGNTWVASTGLPTGFVTSFAKIGLSMLAGTNAGIYVSNDDGISFTLLGMPSANVRFLATKGTEIFAALSDGSIRYSADNGTTWSKQGTVTFLNGLAASANELVAATSSGLYHSGDNALTWAKIDATSCESLVGDGSKFLIGVSGRIKLYHGNSLIDLTTPLPVGLAPAVAIDGNNILASTSSTDGITGSVWSRSITGIPTLQSVSPLSGNVGSIITITGTNFSADPSKNHVKLNGVPAPTIGSTTTSIQALVPVLFGTASVSIEVNGDAVSSFTNFTILPKIESIQPAQGYANTYVTISGTGFDSQHILYASFNSVAAAIYTQGNSVVAIVPPNATSGSMTFSTTDVTYLASASYTILPLITSFSPAGAQAGDLVTISGSGFGASSEVATVSFNGVPGVIQVRSPNTIQVLVPAGSISGPLSVTVSGHTTTAAIPFILLPLPEFCFTLPPQPLISVAKDSTDLPILSSNSPGGNQWYFNGVVVHGATDPTLVATESGTYSVIVTLLGCSSPQSLGTEIRLVTITGIDQRADGPSLTVFPNPASDEITISLNGFPSGRIALDIYSEMGIRVASLNELSENAVTIPTSQYRSGLYLIRVKQTGRTYASKFIKR